MFQKTEFGQEAALGGASSVLWLARSHDAAPIRPVDLGWRERVKYWAQDVHLVPDLGQNLFTPTWLRGLATCFALCFTAIKLTPDFEALPAPPMATPSPENYDEIRSQMVTPLALGADSGRRMAASDIVAPLPQAPERPMLQLNAAIGAGDSFAHALSRSGVASGDIARITGLVGMDVAPASLAAGTRLAITLGRRTNRNLPRPLDALDFRARLDLAIQIRRVDGELRVTRVPIAVDPTPLRIRGTVSDSIYRAARAAGAEPGTIQTYLRVIAQQISLDRIGPGDRFDIIVAHRRAATGESETGELLYGGLQLSGGKKLDMLKWQGRDGRSQWYEASGVGESRPALASPVAGYLSSGFGMRFHPILGYSRMHAGVDFAAPRGAPIYAVSDGVIAYSGWHGGHGNYVKINHDNGLGTGYAHMSRIAAYAGQRVRRGQVIGYVGSTGLSTGPHLHYEVYRNGSAVNPMSVKFLQTSQLTGADLAAFRARLARLKALSAPGSGPAVAVIPASALRPELR